VFQREIDSLDEHLSLDGKENLNEGLLGRLNS
jgi:hypothetical protein